MDWQHLRSVSPEGHSVWRRRLGRIGLLGAFATSAAMFASALGGIASIDVGAEAASKLHQTPVVQAHDVRYDSSGCPYRHQPQQKTEQS
jgi:hypothetical protein